MKNPLKSVQFLGSEIPMPFRFTARLPFSQEDKHDMPWLDNEIRYYGIEEELKKGGRAIAYKGFVSDSQGNRLNNLEIVIKVPNLKDELYDSGQIEEYLSRQSKEGGREWQLTRKRLYGCPYANPIFDFDINQITYLGELLPLPVTAQKFLHNATSLDDYLLNIHQRVKPYDSKRGIPVDNWNGMSDPDMWIQLARGIAIGLTDIHERRVVHGDIWPPNIFIRVDDDNKPLPIFIDFGEAFPIEPKGDPRKQRDHAYRAPERNDAQSIVTQQADVYSYGKLLLHLAIGEEPILSPKYRGHERRAHITEKFALRNANIAKDNPFIIDIICKCVSLDPVDRPSMRDILRALNSYVDTKSYPIRKSNVSERLISLTNTWERVTAELSSRNTSVGPFLEELIEQRMDDVEEMMNELTKDVVTLRDTRERLILALIGLFQRLDKGDRYLSVTNPRMWQGTALGLDGRYFTAMELATSRGASIQRAFIISIQEVGDEWASEFAHNLERLNEIGQNPKAGRLANSLRLEINKYIAARHLGEALDLPEELQVSARQRLALVIKSYLDTSRGMCKNAFDESDKFSSSAQCTGLYVGFIVVSTLSAMRVLRSAHPVSVLFYSNAEQPHDQYLLVMTDCLGRSSYGSGEENISDDIALQKSKPELRGIKVFKSVLGIPKDRIKKLEQIFRQSINIGGWVDQLYGALPHSQGQVIGG